MIDSFCHFHSDWASSGKEKQSEFSRRLGRKLASAMRHGFSFEECISFLAAETRSEMYLARFKAGE
jgi:hypothetical protein